MKVSEFVDIIKIVERVKFIRIDYMKGKISKQDEF